MRKALTRAGGVLTAAVLVTGTFSQSASATGTTRLPAPRGAGVYVGAGAPALLDSFANWRGSRPNFVVDYLARSRWSDIESPTWWLTQWQKRNAPLVLGVPMLLDGSGTTLGAGATGAYDGHFVALARTLVHGGYGNASLRVGWEMNGDWYRWSAKPNPAAWKAYYRHIVTAMRRVPGQHFTFDWTMNLGSSAMRADVAYPGNDVVDIVGVDAYDWKWGDRAISPAARWNWMRTQTYGLNWVASFAAAHRKRISVPEWGLAIRSLMQGGGGGDDPYYVRAMLAWTAAHHTVYQSYYDAQNCRISNNQFPRASSAYRAHRAPVAATPRGVTIVTVRATAARVTAGKRDTFSLTLKTGTRPVAGARVKLREVRAGSHTWSYVSQAVTGRTGVARFSVPIARGNSHFQTVYLGSGTRRPAHSRVIAVQGI